MRECVSGQRVLSMCICIDGSLVTYSASCDLSCLCSVQVRDLINSDGESLTEVQPGHPVGIIGLKVCTASYRDLHLDQLPYLSHYPHSISACEYCLVLVLNDDLLLVFACTGYRRSRGLRDGR